MFDFLPQPWRNTSALVKIEITSILKSSPFKKNYTNVVQDSIYFSSSILEFQTANENSTNPRMRRNKVRFPLKHIEYYEIEEYFEDKAQAPTMYTLTFYVQFKEDTDVESALKSKALEDYEG